MKNTLVLGAGMVGSVMAEDLIGDGDLGVTLADISEPALARAVQRCGGRLQTRAVDLSSPSVVRELAKDFDVVLGALPSRFGYRALEAVLAAGRPYCDISFMPQDALGMKDNAREVGVAAVVDCGVAPGMSNLFSGLAVQRLDPCEKLEIFVGGLPVARDLPHQYKAGFAPYDVIEEYTRPARVVEAGREVIKDALSEPEFLAFDGIGTLEAFNTDGLRSLMQTLHVPDMSEKTLRYPGHRELMWAMRETGLFSDVPIDVQGQSVIPRAVTSALLFPQWTYEEGEPDLTVMRVIADGLQDGQRVRLTWDLDDRYDPVKGQTSMARTTAFPCTLVARHLLTGRIDPGVWTLESLAHDGDFCQGLLSGLEARGVRFAEARIQL